MQINSEIVIKHFPNFFLTENELGETALDVSRKLKHNDCEALVRSLFHDSTSDDFNI